MGQEIVYCCLCQAQIRTSDFVKGGALKLGDRACCVKCGPTLLATLNPKEQEQFFREAAKLKGAPTPTARHVVPATARHAVPTSPPPPVKTGGAPVALWAGVGAVVLALGLVMVLRSPAPAPAPPRAAPPPPAAPAPLVRAKTPVQLREEAALLALEEIRAVEKGGRFAPDEIRRRYAEFAKEYADTPQGRSIRIVAPPAPPPEPAAPEVKPEAPKPVEVPKAPEPPPKPPLTEVKLPDPVAPPAVAPRRLPLPDLSRQRDAEAAVRKAFNTDQAKTPKDKADLARNLLQTASASGAKDAELYALLRQARLLAAQGGDWKLALEAIDRISVAFEVDALIEKGELFTKTTLRPADAAAWGGAALDVAEEASEADDHETAMKLAARAEALGKAAGDRGLQETAKERHNQYGDLKRMTDGLKPQVKVLESKPEDPAANLALGRFTCLIRGDWKRGLPMLAKGSDPALKALAEQELGIGGDAAAMAALGEGWAAQAEKETGIYKVRARGRAAEWLSRALPGLNGLTKVTAEKKLTTLGTPGFSKDRPALDLGGGARVELIYVKAGAFTMGGPLAAVAVWEADQRSEHRVTLTKGFYLGKYEVTRGQFAAFVKATGFKTEAEKAGTSWGLTPGGSWADVPGLAWNNTTFTQTDEHPVICVNWHDAKAFCDWASKKSGRVVRLPTEAEWEYACRAGTKGNWSWGDDEGAAENYAWVQRNSASQTHPIGLKKPNPWGFFDIHGNAWEWCQDWSAPYPTEAIDPVGPASGELKISRGGRWDGPPFFGHSAFRGQVPALSRHSYLGFRVAAN